MRCWWRRLPTWSGDSTGAAGVARAHPGSPAAGVGFGRGWLCRHGCGEHPLNIAARVLTVTSNDAAISAALAGFGIARPCRTRWRKRSRPGSLQVLMPQYEPPEHPHILHREGRHASARVSAFIDLLARSGCGLSHACRPRATSRCC
ncbi:MAG: LysR substrate-binding domain-containing protein [Halioglobus sp.]